MDKQTTDFAREPWCPRPDGPCASPMCSLTSEVNQCVTAVRDYADGVTNRGLTLAEHLIAEDLEDAEPARPYCTCSPYPGRCPVGAWCGEQRRNTPTTTQEADRG